MPIRAALRVMAASLERFAAHLSEDAKRYPERQFYRGYAQGVRDGRDGAEHALRWLDQTSTPTTRRRRQEYPNE